MKPLAFLTCLVICFACTKRQAALQNNGSVLETIPSAPSLTTPTQSPPQVGLEIGNKAPELVLGDTSNIPIRLSSLSGKYVLIDFWASWCKPCRMENAKLIGVYSRYRDTLFKDCKGFEIYSVSLDVTRKSWIQYIHNDHYNWKYNVWDSIQNGQSATGLYKINFIPQNFLIDRNGIIVAKDLRDTMVEKTLRMLF